MSGVRQSELTSLGRAITRLREDMNDRADELMERVHELEERSGKKSAPPKGKKGNPPKGKSDDDDDDGDDDGDDDEEEGDDGFGF